MRKNEQAKFSCHVDGLVAAVVVDENADIDELRQFGHSGRQRFLRVVSGHNHRDALAVDHRFWVISLPEPHVATSDLCQPAF
jgi:hypothetical protein